MSAAGTTDGRRRIAALALGVVLVLGLVGPVPAAGAAPAHAQEDPTQGLRVESRTTYTVDLAGSVVRVHHDVTLTNQTPDRVSGAYVEQYYFHAFSIPILGQGTGVVAQRGDGRGLGVTVEPVEGGLISFAVVDLSPNLFYGQTQTIRLSYDIVGVPPRSGAAANVNPAFATFPVFAVGDPGLSGVEVVVPQGPDVEVVGEPLDRSSADGTVVYAADAIADPLGWFTTLVVRDDSQLAERVVEYGESEVRVQGWPDDPEWLDVTSRLAEDGLPALEAVIGFGWDEPRELVIVETVTPYVYGYGGWYDSSRELIEVGDSLDDLVTLHEMAHAWFNDQLFQGRWISEAFADEVAARAMEALGDERPRPEPIDVASPVRRPLNDWTVPALDDPDSEAIESYGYNTSWSIAHSLFEEIGPEQMAEVLRAVDERRTPYPATTVDDTLDTIVGWRNLLDLLEEVGGSTEAEQLFRDHVVATPDLAVLDDRAAARTAYDELVAAGDGWAPPAVLRDRMAWWDFDDAAELVPEVEELLDVRDELAADLAVADLDLPAPLHESFEAATDLDDLAEVMDDADDAAEALREAVEERDGLDPLGRVGVLFSDVDDDLDSARAAVV